MCFITADGVKISPEKERVYSYAKYHTDKVPSLGWMEFDNTERKWLPLFKDTPVFKERKNVMRFIEMQHDPDLNFKS